MNYLITDTTDKALTVIAVKGGEEFVSFSQENVRHNSQIMPAIDRILQESALEIGDINVFSAVTGPGSFTGIRIGVTVMNAFSDVTGGKLVEVNTFEMIGHNQKNVIALIDARNNNFYGAEFREGEIVRMGDYKLADLDLNLIRKIYRKNCDYSRALIDIVRKKAQAGDFVKRLTPLYLKYSQAERELLKKNCRISPMQYRYIEQIMEIEKASFLTPWSDKQFLEAVDNEEAYCFVIEANDEVIGYAVILQLFDVMHIMKIAVKDTMRRQGYSEIMLSHILEKTLSNIDISSITLEVRVSNVAAQALYRKYGMKCKGIRRMYYGNEDALIYTLELGR